MKQNLKNMSASYVNLNAIQVKDGVKSLIITSVR